MKLIIVRHAETEDNIRGIMQGQRPGKLTKRGKEQAKRLAERLKNEKIDVIFSSDLQRVKETTVQIAKFHKVPIYFASQLREKRYGIFEGKPAEEFYKARKKSRLPKEKFKPKGGESLLEVRERAQKFLNRLLKLKRYKNKTILISSHGTFIKILLGIILKKPIKEAIKMEQSNTALNVIEIKENSKKVAKIINCIKHL